MAGIGKKPPVFATREAAFLLDGLSKAALLDICWNLAQLGTDESPEQVLTRVCREAEIVADGRGDRLPDGMRDLAKRWIDSDPPQLGGE